MLQNVTVLGDRAFKEVIKFKKFLSVGPNSTWLVFLLGIRRQREKHLKVTVRMQRRDHHKPTQT